MKAILSLLLACALSLPVLVTADDISHGIWLTTARNAQSKKYIYEGWLHANRPDVYLGKERLGIRHLDFISPNNKTYLVGLWTNSTTEMPPAAWYDALAANYTHTDHMLILDMEENGGTMWKSTTQAERLTTAANLVTMYNALKSRMPTYKIGFYNFPHTGRKAFVGTVGDAPTSQPGGAEFLQFQADNDDFSALWAVVDFIAPSLYYPYDLVDNPGLALIAQPYIHNYFYYNILDTRRCIAAYSTKNPPIISYVWHRPTQSQTSYIDVAVWDDMIRTAYTQGDGMILWSLNTEPTWDDNAWWWIRFKAQFPFGDRYVVKPRVKIGDTLVTSPSVTDRSTGTAVHLGTSITWSHTSVASLNSALVACVPWQDNETPTWTATANGVSMTLVSNNQVSTDGVAAFVLVNPPVGTYSMVVSAGATTINDFNAFAVSMNNVNQSTPTRAPYTGSATTGTFGLTVVNSQDGDMVVACDVVVASSAPVNEFQDKTNTTDSIIGSSARSGALSTKYASGANTTTGLSITSSTWRGIAFAVAPVTGTVVGARNARN